MLSAQPTTFDAWDRGVLDFIRERSLSAAAAGIADLRPRQFVPPMQEIIIEMLAQIERC